jgi:2-polyprenyl-6-methoxyphenol hydroxylase-like FAD-dependent oxidoreductase
VTVTCGNGKTFTGQALIGADGVRSVVRAQYVNDPPRVTGHVVYRAVVDEKDFPDNLKWNAASIWVGPNCHLVHYPLRGGKEYNVVVTFHSRGKEEWGVTEGSKEEVQSYFQGICPKARQLIDLPKSGSAGPPPTASRSRNGPTAAPRCSATPPTRPPNTWRRAPAWRWKMR